MKMLPIQGVLVSSHAPLRVGAHPYIYAEYYQRSRRESNVRNFVFQKSQTQERLLSLDTMPIGNYGSALVLIADVCLKALLTL